MQALPGRVVVRMDSLQVRSLETETPLRLNIEVNGQHRAWLGPAISGRHEHPLGWNFIVEVEEPEDAVSVVAIGVESRDPAKGIANGAAEETDEFPGRTELRAEDNWGIGSTRTLSLRTGAAEYALYFTIFDFEKARSSMPEPA